MEEITQVFVLSNAVLSILFCEIIFPQIIYLFHTQHLFTLKGEYIVELELKIIMFHRLGSGKKLTEKFFMRDNILFFFQTIIGAQKYLTWKWIQNFTRVNTTKVKPTWDGLKVLLYFTPKTVLNSLLLWNINEPNILLAVCLMDFIISYE